MQPFGTLQSALAVSSQADFSFWGVPGTGAAWPGLAPFIWFFMVALTCPGGRSGSRYHCVSDRHAAGQFDAGGELSGLDAGPPIGARDSQALGDCRGAEQRVLALRGVLSSEHLGSFVAGLRKPKPPESARSSKRVVRRTLEIPVGETSSLRASV